ncbi:UNVERIFIED_CONTAM: Transcription factor ABORTED MICROSPORES [Sesamum latifolium]|uniref:Transcription factor ABORTED MICROSPORES n=1 Tax=Sesamum latifolium TaxID=2727402 RepID=A0AAW2XY33_9LAMI
MVAGNKWNSSSHPVACGLIELFSTNHVPRDQKIIDYISARFNINLKQENANEKDRSNYNLGDKLCGPDHSSFHYLNFLPQIPQPNNYSSFEGSSTCSSLSNDHQLLQIGPDPMFVRMSPEKSSREYVDSPSSSLRLKRKKYTDVALAQCNDQTVAVKIRQKAEKGPYKSKNLMTERNRRKRIKDGMFALRALVPKISKMDRAATLGDAAEYIKELEETIENYYDELRTMEEDSSKINDNAKPDLPKLIRDKSAAGGSEKNPVEVKVEVSQLGRKDFLLKLICNQKRGGFSRLMEAVDSLGLKVTDANVTTFNGSVLNVLQVEANKTEVEPNALKHSLLQLVN